MPYQVYDENGKFCVHKKVGEEKGTLVPGGCHADKSKASAHMRALYAAEGRAKKDLADAEMELVFKELEEQIADKSSSYFPSAITTWEELDAWRESEDAVNELRSTSSDFQSLVLDVLWDINIPNVKEKALQIKSLAEKLAARLETDIEEADAEDAEHEDDTETKGTASDNNLPDSAFLYVESGEKDSEGKTTPRSKRHLPYKKADGSVDLPRLRNALSRLGQPKTGKVEGESWLSEGVRKRLQARGKKILASANKSLGEKIKEWIESMVGIETKEAEPDDSGMLLWKEADGTWRWGARYSNNFRDRDNPPEIISAQSHEGFVDKVDKGLVPKPQLWLWHLPEYAFGDATWCAYDDAGFALAMGTVRKGCEPIAEALSRLDPKELRVSHGMPKKSIVYDPEDPTVIIEHVTAEISPLPARAAANMLTSFTILKEESMAIPNDKKKALIEELGIPAAVLDELEKKNADMAKEAKQAGIQSKETVESAKAEATKETPETVPPVTASSTPVPTTAEAPTLPATPNPTVQEIADAVSNVVNDRLTAINQRFDTIDATIATLQDNMKSLKETDESKIAKIVAQTPSASLGAILAKSVTSVIGNPETKVDGRFELAKSKPETAPELPSNPAPNIGYFVVDKLIKEFDQSKAS
jgi:hypothetical protein